ncbi:hypothetical protein HPP92_000542 [Vanilla planifolia]|uniref:GDSL esterase/lipase n=1 Tax=Vanilla planifolia TaxID=51239 RepID=A0A835VGQ3_VANPL|nr:hypothetical protein HPP92_000542 [Vanilla planifolia]
MAKNIVFSCKLALSLVVLSLFLLTAFSCSKAEVKGMFVFGSSLVDNGNNNFLKNSTAKANYSPYGIDFPLGPSGRFSNGRNTIDVLGELLHLPGFLPPFADPRTEGAEILHGVNFASGGSGILDETGSLAVRGEVLSLNRQIWNFENKTLPDLKAQLRGRGDDRFSDGGNDYLLNYFVPGQTQKPSLLQFTQLLVSQLTRQLKKLYDVGARKFVLFSIQPIGCIPVVRANLPVSNGSCIEQLNEAALLFNDDLKALATNLKLLLPGSNLVFVNSYHTMRTFIDEPLSYGFSDGSTACCELPSHTPEAILCKREGMVCSNRTAHVFFDGLHPTDAVNFKIAQKAYNSCLLEDAYPSNVKQLAQL